MKPNQIVPQAALDKVKPTELVTQRVLALTGYDLSFITDHLIEEELREFSPEQLFPLIKHFGKYDMKMNLDVSRKLEFEFKRFVALALLKPSRRNAPYGPVDMYWHFFVLHTPEYVQFCTAIFGDYGDQPRVGKHYNFQHWEDKRKAQNEEAMVDHIPAKDDTRPAMFEIYKETLQVYEELYGAPDEKFWPAPTSDKIVTCGDSYSGFIHPLLEKQAVTEKE